MHSYSNSAIKETELRCNNIVHGEESLVSMYTSFLSAEKEGTIKLELYTLLNDQKEILDEVQCEIPRNIYN
ncbi:hypothetical protein LGK97_14800 [Clostridium sp. CS001]|uniref:hypothetical protein n=1 Tax=Clostridium sp. CS001 TaxID=2880648 RepID=UPI001CF1D996|nr:hypothetical protein [Clostridium sp. CS001]MCB2291004.1 hypothetical protein [Clostridium sp. CS001]